MKILLINQTFYPDKMATSQYLTSLALALVARGHEVSVLAGNHGYDDPMLRFSNAQEYHGVHIRRISYGAFGKKSPVSRFLDFASFQFSLLCRLLFFPRQDRVVALTSPPLVATLAAFFCWLKGSKLIYWVMDMNPDEAIAAGWLGEKSIPGRLLTFFSRQAFRASHQIIALDHFVKRRIESRYRASSDKIRVIPPWAHDEHLKPIPHESNPFRQEHGLGEKFVVMYSGNHSPCHPLDTLLETALYYRDDPGILFYFIGGGSGVREVEQFKKKHLLDRVIQMPYQPLEVLSDSLSAADLHVTVMGQAFVGILHPCKIYGILSVGRPFVFVGPKESHMGDLIRESGLGDQVEPGDAQGLIAVIEKRRQSMAQEKISICERSLRFKESRFGQKELTRQIAESIENG